MPTYVEEKKGTQSGGSTRVRRIAREKNQTKTGKSAAKAIFREKRFKEGCTCSNGIVMQCEMEDLNNFSFGIQYYTAKNISEGITVVDIKNDSHVVTRAEMETMFEEMGTRYLEILQEGWAL